MKVYYIYGSAGCGKTSYVFQKHGYDDVYRTTNYEFGWIDDYNGEKILFLDEFRSSFKISEVLDYLDEQLIRIRGRHYNRQPLESLKIDFDSFKCYNINTMMLAEMKLKPLSGKFCSQYFVYCLTIHSIY